MTPTETVLATGAGPVRVAAHVVVGGCIRAWRVRHREPCLPVFSAAGVRPGEHVEHLADRPFAGDGVAEWEMRLDPVAVAPPGLLLDQVPGIDEIVHDAMCPPLGDVDLDSDVAETYAGVVCDAEQGACVVGEEAPTRHGGTVQQFRKHIACLLVQV